jgi:hypothetical protein
MTSHTMIHEAFDQAAEELDGFLDRIIDRPRTIRAVELEDGRWCAKTGEDRTLFPPCSDRLVVERFVAAFAQHDDRFRVVAAEPVHVHSVRVDNVVPIGGTA